MVKKIFLSLSIIALLLSSCENTAKSMYYDEECDYSNCDGYEPFYTYLDIRFSRTNENPNPLIYIMIGDFEEQNIIDTIKTDTIENYMFWTEIEVPLNFNYTVCAEYLIGDDTIMVIDGNYVYKKTHYVCDSTCWDTYNENFNVKLKF
ncbi:MAG: hypothetical protein JXL97_00435 [Bacteroidales bacterium]|nr:hypothetical protein [Bacteroidales bacterium]